MKFIEEILSGSLSKDGYKEFLTFIRMLIIKNNWPKYILEENQYTKDRSFWEDKDYLSFANQFILDLLSKNKIKFLIKITSEARYSYLSTILCRYVADRINEKQRELSISYRQIKDIFDLYINKESTIKSLMLQNSKHISNLKNFGEKPLDEKELDIYLRNITFSHMEVIDNKKINLTEYVKKAVNYILDIIGSPIKEEVLINFLHNKINELFSIEKREFNDATMNYSPINILATDDFSDIYKAIIKKLNEKEHIILKNYFFNQDQLTLQKAERELLIPKSTISYITNKISILIREHFTPSSTEEAMTFLINFEKFLEKT